MGIATILPTDCRVAPRRGLFLSAMLFADGRNWPVRVRNISESGAMVEGVRLPELGSVQLCRADHQAVASIVWASGKRRGLKFQGKIDLADWIPSAEMGGQQDVDIRIARARNAQDGAHPSATEDPPIYARVAEELRLAGRRLESTLDRFSDEPHIVMRHGVDLQTLEVMQQLLGRLAAVVAADDPVAEARKIGMEEVKRRLLR